MEKRVIRLFLLLGGIMEMAPGFVMAMYVPFLLQHHITLPEANLINAVYWFTNLLMEIPTGVIADTWGRKPSLVCYGLLMTAGFTVYGLGHTALWFCLAEVLIAIGQTCASGAFEAWFIDSLDHAGQARFEHLLALSWQVRSVVSIGTALLTIAIIPLGLSTLWFAGAGASLVLTVLVLFLMHEPYRDRAKRQTKLHLRQHLVSAWDTTKSGLSVVRHNPHVRLVAIIGAVAVFCLQAPNMQWQVRLTSLHWPEHLLPMAWIGVMLTSLVGSTLAKRTLKHRVSHLRTLLLLGYLGTGLFLSLSGAAGGVAGTALAFFALHQISRGFVGPLATAYENRDVPSNVRATVGSSVSMLSFLVGGTSLLLMSGALKLAPPAIVWVGAGVILSAAAIVMLLPARARRELQPA